VANLLLMFVQKFQMKLVHTCWLKVDQEESPATYTKG